MTLTAFIIYLAGFIIYWWLYASFIRACGLAIASAVINNRSKSMVDEIFQIYRPNLFFSIIYLPLVFLLMIFFAMKKIYQSS